jgi:glycosyltransferase involved in cell wall biosynthesis
MISHSHLAVPPLRLPNPLISLVVPVYNEQETIPLFIETVHKFLINHKYEIVFINDGSTDTTFPLLLQLAANDSSLRLVNLARNFGKEAALTAGITAAAGDVVIPLDVDLQDPPELIPVFLEKWKEGYNVVYGVRSARTSDTVLKRLTAGGFYRVFNRFSRVKLPENAGDFRLLDRRVVTTLLQLPERNRFMKGLFAWVGFPSIGIPYERPARAAGTTTWNYWKLWNFALDGLFAFSTLPLRIWSYVGVCIAFFAFLYASFIVGRVLLLGRDVPGYASLLTLGLFIGGIQLISTGIIGEYIGRMFEEVKGRPVFVVEGIYQNGRRCETPSPEA